MPITKKEYRSDILMQDIFTVKFSSYFEHVCSLDKVLFTIEATNKHVIIQCENCHRKIFYRKVELNSTYNRIQAD